MSSEKGQKSDHSKKIVKIFAEKPAVSFNSLKESENTKMSYALIRTGKHLIEAGFAQLHKSDNEDYVRITKKGKTKLHSLKLVSDDALVSNTWDGFWRIIILDLGEDRKSEREALRYLLKKANFVCIKNTVWISPFPYEHLFTNIKKDLGLTTELMIIVTEKLDLETANAFLKATKGN